MHPIRQYILGYASLTTGEWSAIEPCWIHREYPAGVTLLREGDVCRRLYFLESGFLRFHGTRDDGADFTKFFTEAPYCFTSQRSFTREMAATESIETLEASVIWEMPRSAAFDLLRLPGWSAFVRSLVQEVQGYTQDLLEEAQQYTAEARYARLLRENSIILQKAPLKDVASFLGIAPQSLSRIRKRMLER